MFTIEPLGTDLFLPAFLIGYRISEERAARSSARPKAPSSPSARKRDGEPEKQASNDCPPWLLRVDQQAGGMCMSYPHLMGMLLRFEANRDKLLDDDIIRGLKFMAEDPKVGVLRRCYPPLGRLVHTVGQDYSAVEREELHGFLSRYLRCPPLVGGIEACVHCDPNVDLLDFFAGWRVLSVEVRPGHELPEVYRGVKGTISEEVDLKTSGPLHLSDPTTFDHTLLRKLRRHAEALGMKGPPSAYLLWENSD